ncbi:hypothetical protein [Acrocarpospora catenulata]|uniref:hypothetical protein n=1 Tax=Acrocarpospora catenulata TaxID=2836182 RepID=UPI001BDA9640|nr:hypothetical protein [Acrocarpospora catenulata]
MARLISGVLIMLLLTGCDLPGLSQETVLCHHEEIPLQALKNPIPATNLGPNGRAALKGTEVRPIDDLSTWTIAEETDTRVAIIREKSTPEPNIPGGQRTHEFLSIERVAPPGQTSRPSWHMRASTRCNLYYDLGSLSPADVQLDPATPPAPDSRRISLLITEHECASGKPADGRIQLAEIQSTPTEIHLTIGVRHLDTATCPGNPQTPFTVTLDEPLGDRVLIDASLYPSRPIALATK